MRLYRVQNTSDAWWVFADSEEEALDISMLGTSTRKRENLKIIGDATDFYKDHGDFQKFIASGQKGIGSLRLEGAGKWQAWYPKKGAR